MREAGLDESQRRARVSDEIVEFNATFLKQIKVEDALTEKLELDSRSELRAFEKRNPDSQDVKTLRKRIETQSASMNQLKDELTKTKYLGETVEEARKAGIELMSANVALLARIDHCLQNPNPCVLEKEEDEVLKARTHWKSLLAPR